MAIKYYLRQLGGPTSAAGKYTAQIKPNSTILLKDLINLVAARKTAIGKGDIASTLETLCEVMEAEVTAGNIVHLGGIARLWATIKGTFDSPVSPYDTATHSVAVAAAVNSRLRRAVRDNASVERVDPVSHLPLLLEFANVTSGNVDSDINPGGLGQLSGSNLSFDATDSNQGLFLYDAIGDLIYNKVPAIQKRGDKEIVFQVPTAASTYTECYLILKRKQTPTGDLITGKTSNLTVSA